MRRIGVWRAAAGARIAQTSPSAYEEAAHLLRKYRTLLERLDRGAEWAPYVAAIRTANRRKRKLLEILDGLEGHRRTILES